MKVSVCASVTYYYEVEVNKALCARNSDGDLINEAGLTNRCIEADPITITGADDMSGYLISICNATTGEELYVG